MAFNWNHKSFLMTVNSCSHNDTVFFGHTNVYILPDFNSTDYRFFTNPKNDFRFRETLFSDILFMNTQAFVHWQMMLISLMRFHETQFIILINANFGVFQLKWSISLSGQYHYHRGLMHRVLQFNPPVDLVSEIIWLLHYIYLNIRI